VTRANWPLVLSLRQIAANVAKLFWTPNKQPLASAAFVRMHRFVAEGFELAVSHFRRLVCGIFAWHPSAPFAGESSFNYSADSLRPRRLVVLRGNPSIQSCHQRWLHTNHNGFALAGRGGTPFLFLWYHGLTWHENHDITN
jgi:hypothetical protein